MDPRPIEILNYNLALAREVLDSVPGGPRIFAAILMLVVGWIATRLLTAVFTRVLKKLDLDGRLARGLGSDSLISAHEKDPDRFERVFERIFYYGLLVFLAIAILEVLGLSMVSEPLMAMLTDVTAGVPDVLKALAIMFVAWVAAAIARRIVGGLVGKLRLDEKLAELRGEALDDEKLEHQHTMTRRLTGNFVFYAVLLLAVAPALGALGLDELATPVRGLIDDFLAIVPRAFGAGLTVLVGWIAARVARQALTALLSSTGFDEAATRVGFDKLFQKTKASEVAGALAYWLILIPVGVSAVQTLQLEGLSEPLSAVLTEVLGQVPNILAALGILFVAVIAGRWVGSIVKGLAESLGADSLMAKIGVGKLTEKMDEGERSVSALLGAVARILVVLMGLLQGLHLVGLTPLADLLRTFLNFLPQVGLAILILAVGMLLGNYVHGLIDDHLSHEGNVLLPRFLGVAAKVIIIVFAGMVASQEIGLAEDLVLSAFTILFGAFCLALALAFGLGSREAAGEIVREQLERARAVHKPQAE
jgi:small-conductance mechanosensitive channel